MYISRYLETDGDYTTSSYSNVHAKWCCYCICELMYEHFGGTIHSCLPVPKLCVVSQLYSCIVNCSRLTTKWLFRGWNTCNRSTPNQLLLFVCETVFSWCDQQCRCSSVTGLAVKIYNYLLKRYDVLRKWGWWNNFCEVPILIPLTLKRVIYRIIANYLNQIST